jgi:hypothetical protein
MSKIKFLLFNLFFIQFALVVIISPVKANENQEQKLKWTDYFIEFTPASSNPEYLVVRKSTFQEFVEMIKTNEAVYEKKMDSLKIVIGNQDQQIKNSLLNDEKVTQEAIVKLKSSYYDRYILTLSLSIILSLVLFFLLYLWYKNGEQVKLHEESIQNIEDDFLRYKRSTLEREKKMTREIIDLKKIINPEE